MRTALLVAAQRPAAPAARPVSALVTAFVAPWSSRPSSAWPSARPAAATSTAPLVRVADRRPGDSPATTALVDAIVRWAQPGPGIAVVRSPSVQQALARLGTRAGSRRSSRSRAGFATATRIPFPDVIADRDSPIGQSVAFALAQGMVEAAATAAVGAP